MDIRIIHCGEVAWNICAALVGGTAAQLLGSMSPAAAGDVLLGFWVAASLTGAVWIFRRLFRDVYISW